MRSASSTRARRASRTPSSRGPREVIRAGALEATGERDGLLPALTAVRARLGLVAGLLVLGGGAWWSAVDRMQGMDAGPGTALGALGWFLGVWVVMMAAMMLPSVVPTVALYTTMTRSRGADRPLLFAGAYLVVWGAAGGVAL